VERVWKKNAQKKHENDGNLLNGPQRVCYHALGSLAPLLNPRSASMDVASSANLSIAALACSVAALLFSLLAAFPGLKHVLAALRDGILWFALFLVLGGVASVVWQQVQQQAVPGITASHAEEPLLRSQAETMPAAGR
jgi:hypothetical protein